MMHLKFSDKRQVTNPTTGRMLRAIEQLNHKEADRFST